MAAPSPTFIPVVRQGADMVFGDVTVSGGLDVAGGLDVGGYAEFGAGQFDGQLNLWSGTADALRLGTPGGGIAIAEGAQATQGLATLVAGVAVVPTNKVAANSRVQLTVQQLGTVTTPQAVAVTARTPGTNFTITSADLTDTSSVAWTIFTPA